MSCYKYWPEIEEIAEELENYGVEDINDIDKLNEYDLEEIKKQLDRIEVIAHDKTIDFDSAKHILDNERMNKALKLIRKFYLYIGARLETDNAIEILEADDPEAILNKFHFYERYEGLLENESKLAKFNKDKTFVFIGSGPLPLTLIMFRKKFGCKCIGIEIQPDVAELSRKVIDKLGLSDGIEIIVGDERKISDIDFDILMVAAFAEPKEKVFANVWERVTTKTPVLVRTYSGMRAILYAPLTDKQLRGFHKEVMLLPIGNTNNTSVLLRKIE
ncbi:nicotianamine synthase family protein [Methanosphaera cuniculi]|uniref:Methyltransferase n=1 Tax=Methanosphaera cuniculi TaxID=1077256 RepID=A0A2A2HFW7_9EURY|nr:nicotianamine synthase family protein [Methanosphaera cuniculi]PAV08133.1 methyltransferase [Methanosphaera cuniculi]PWL07770.1 nicotianamine synthase protein [Methanosphaera cuniculi]